MMDISEDAVPTEPNLNSSNESKNNQDYYDPNENCSNGNQTTALEIPLIFDIDILKDEELEDFIKNLKAQIEAMKNCSSCLLPKAVGRESQENKFQKCDENPPKKNENYELKACRNENSSMSSAIIGSGKFGNVYFIQKGDKEYALKRMDRDLFKKGRCVDVIENLRLQALFKHKNILSILGISIENWLEEGPSINVLLPLKEKASLDKHKEPFSLRRAFTMFKKLAEALAYLKKQRIVHRNIKGGNVVIDENYEPYVCGLGFAKRLVLEYIGPHDKRQGNEFYMAPERLREDKYNCKSDVWSLGIMLYFLLFKRSPPNKEKSVILSIGHAPQEYLTRIKDDIKSLLEKDQMTNVETMLEKIFCWAPDDEEVDRADEDRRSKHRICAEELLNELGLRDDFINGLNDNINEKQHLKSHSCKQNFNSHSCKDEVLEPSLSEVGQPSVRTRNYHFNDKESNKKRGCAVIIDIENFDKLPKRRGTHKDDDKLKKFFEKNNYICDESTCKRDLTSSEATEFLEQIRALDHKNHDILVVCILSHGKYGKVAFKDDQFLKLDDHIISVFNEEHCKDLKGKPKVFIIQACQDAKDEVVLENQLSKIIAPKSEHFVLALSSSLGKVSYRENERGSFFIQHLCRCLKTGGSLNEVLEQVRQEVYDYSQMMNCEQVPVELSNLHKAVYLRTPQGRCKCCHCDKH